MNKRRAKQPLILPSLLLAIIAFVKCSDDCTSTVPISGTVIIAGVAQTVIDVTMGLGDEVCLQLLAETGNPIKRIRISSTKANATARQTFVSHAIPNPSVTSYCYVECGIGGGILSLASDPRYCNNAVLTNLVTSNVGGSCHCDGPFNTGSCNSYFSGAQYCLKSYDELSLYKVSQVSDAEAVLNLMGTQLKSGVSLTAVSVNGTFVQTFITQSVNPQALLGQVYTYSDKYRCGYLAPSISATSCQAAVSGSTLWLQDNAQGTLGYNNCLHQATNSYPANSNCGYDSSLSLPQFSTSQCSANAGIGANVEVDPSNPIAATVYGIAGTISVRFTAQSSIVSANIYIPRCTLVSCVGNVEKSASDISFIANIAETNQTRCWVRSPYDQLAELVCSNGKCGGSFTSDPYTGGEYCSLNCIYVYVNVSEWNTTYAGWTPVAGVVADESSHDSSSSVNWRSVLTSLFTFGVMVSGPFSSITSSFIALGGFLFSLLFYGSIIAILLKLLPVLKAALCKTGGGVGSGGSANSRVRVELVHMAGSAIRVSHAPSKKEKAKVEEGA